MSKYDELESLFFDIRNRVIYLINERNININLLAFDLKIDEDTFIERLRTRYNDFLFYLETLHLVENWEG